MKKIVTASLVAAIAITSVNASSLTDRLNALEDEIASLKSKVKKQNKKINKVKAHDASDNIKWGVDLRTSIDNIDYNMAGKDRAGNDSFGKNDLMSMRLWLNMAYAPDTQNVFKGQLSMNKAFGASFDSPLNRPFDNFDWTGNEALRDSTLHVRQAYWLYLGEKFLGADIPWTFSVGRRPSTNGFLANLRDDDAAQSPLGHVINVEFDGLSSKLDLSNITGVPGMSIKLCMGQGSTNAVPLIGSATPNANNDNANDDIKLGGFIFEPYNDGQYIVKSTWYRGYDVPGANFDGFGNMVGLTATGDMEGAALSVMIDGLTDEGYFADAKIFGSFAWSKSHPNGKSVTVPDGAGGTVSLPGMLGSNKSETGTSYWIGAQLPITEKGKLGIEFNHGSQYWRAFTYAEDTMIGSKLAARGDAFEVYFNYQLTDALSAQLRYTKIDYDYTGSNGFFGNSTGGSQDITALQEALKNPLVPAAQKQQIAGLLSQTIESAQDVRFYIRYRF